MRLAPSLHRVGSDLVNCYLVEDADGVTVIDAGLPGHWKELQAELATMGRSLDDVRGVVLTHGDTDHLGFAERLRNENGVPIHVHEQDAARARGEDKSNGSWGKVKPGPLLRFLWYAGRRGGFRVPPVTEVVTFTGEDVLDLPGSPVIIHLPGHTPGSVAIHVSAVDALFVGDALTTGHVLTGKKGPQPAPFTLEPELALESLSKLEGVQANWLLPGHGAPWQGAVVDALGQVREAAAS
jgi:glyoxylase-like metal-dependent hydrolase (beta-lactamase superfamily II)